MDFHACGAALRVRLRGNDRRGSRGTLALDPGSAAPSGMTLGGLGAANDNGAGSTLLVGKRSGRDGKPRFMMIGELAKQDRTAQKLTR